VSRKQAKSLFRHEEIVEALNLHGGASAEELAERFGVSLVTMRRDLRHLEESGRIRRTHGGARLSKTSVVEFAYVERGSRNAVEKRAIARELANMIPPESTVAFDSGTTTLEVARAIVDIQGLTVVTNSLAIASVLYAQESIETILVGGTARRKSPDLTGRLTTENLKRFRVDYAVLGADGVNEEGVYTNAVDVGQVCEAVLAAGTKAILLADNSKINRPAFYRYAQVTDFDLIITDEGVTADQRNWLDEAAESVTYVTL